MSIKESEALVLKSYNLAESDRIVVFFTRSYGLVRGVAKGARRLNSRFGSMLEPFSTVNLTYFQKEERELVSIQNAELARSRFSFASDIVFLESFSYIAELLADFAPPHAADETLYRMIDACLAAAAEGAGLDTLKLYFEVWLLRLSGYLPNWENCDICRKPFADEPGAHLMAGFRLRCGRCRTGGVTLATLDRVELDVFNSILIRHPSEFASMVRDRPAAVEMISAIMKRMIAQVLGQEVTGPAALR